jgi:hypothetical protein
MSVAATRIRRRNVLTLGAAPIAAGSRGHLGLGGGNPRVLRFVPILNPSSLDSLWAQSVSTREAAFAVNSVTAWTGFVAEFQGPAVRLPQALNQFLQRGGGVGECAIRRGLPAVTRGGDRDDNRILVYVLERLLHFSTYKAYNSTIAQICGRRAGRVNHPTALLRQVWNIGSGQGGPTDGTHGSGSNSENAGFGLFLRAAILHGP